MLSSWLSRSAGQSPRSSKPAARREPPAAQWGRRARRGAVACFLAAIAAVGVAGFFRARDFLTHSEYFQIRFVRVYGLSDSVERNVVEQAGLDDLKGKNLALLDRGLWERRLAKNPRIASARVLKRYPATVRIDAVERKPAAVVNADRFYRIDSERVLLDVCDSPDAARKESLPLINGLTADGLRLGDKIENPGLAHALDLVARMRKESRGLYDRIGEIHVSDAGELTLLLDKGFEVRFGQADPIESMPALEAFFQMPLDFTKLRYVDLRFDRQLVYR